MRYTGMTCDSTAEALSGVMDKLAEMQQNAAVCATGVMTKDRKIDHAIKSVLNNTASKVATEPDSNGVKTMSCGGSGARKRAMAKYASALDLMSEINETLKKKVQ